MTILGVERNNSTGRRTEKIPLAPRREDWIGDDPILAWNRLRNCIYEMIIERRRAK